ncbi:MAG: enoyl-CoA hydratase/isomerase family protein [Reyranellaceae bacterium]
MTDTVLYEMTGQVAVITLNRPEKRNVVNTAMRDGVLAAWRRFDADPAARVAILTAAGDKAFCAGRDLGEAASGHGHGFIPILRDGISVAKPVIAAINGAALGGGCFMAISCDLCVAVEHATFALTEARVGRAPIYAFWLNGAIPRKVALEMSMTGNAITARRAYELGLVNHVVPAARLMERAMALAADLCAAAPLSVAATKAMLYETAGLDPEAALETALARFKPVFESEDAMEGMRAFRERRPPQWKGR